MKKPFFLILLSLIIFSCDPGHEELTDDSETLKDLNYPDYSDDADYVEYITENSIDDKINFMPVEMYDDQNPQPPSLKLKLATVDEYPCMNFELGTTQITNGNELIIRFDEIMKRVVCLTAIGPAVSYIDLPEDTEKITFINGNIIDKYYVEINEEKVSLSLVKNNFTSSTHDKTFRYPENSFAYVVGTHTSNTDIYTSFLTILKQNSKFSAFEFEGEGRIPYPVRTSGHYVNHPSKFFLYSDEEAFENLKEVLRNFSAENIEKNTGVTIKLVGWNNKVYRSWMTD